jgi:hypothetical protein
MTTSDHKLQLVDEQTDERDFIDEIAALLPAEQRPLWYRDMAHLRRLPDDDEMLRIARAMGFLAIVTRQAPAEIASERDRLAAILDQSVKAIQSARHEMIAFHRRLDERLTRLPSQVSEGINPQTIAAVLGESVRQNFIESGLPETAESLTVVAKQTKQVAADFDRSSKYLANSYRVAAEDARKSLEDMRLTIQTATNSAKQCATELTHTFLREYKWSVLVLCSAALAVGFSLGTVWYRWVNSNSTDPAPIQNVVAVPLQQQTSNPAPVHSGKSQHKAKSYDRPSQ